MSSFTTAELFLINGISLPFRRSGTITKSFSMISTTRLPNKGTSGANESRIGMNLGIPMNTICRCNSLRRAYEYLWHKNNPEKHQYSPDIVQTHDFNIPSESNSGREEEEQVRILLDMPAFETTYECARWAWENKVWAAFRRGYAIWRDIRNETHGGKY